MTLYSHTENEDPSTRSVPSRRRFSEHTKSYHNDYDLKSNSTLRKKRDKSTYETLNCSSLNRTVGRKQRI